MGIGYYIETPMKNAAGYCLVRDFNIIKVLFIIQIKFLSSLNYFLEISETFSDFK